MGCSSSFIKTNTKISMKYLVAVDRSDYSYEAFKFVCYELYHRIDYFYLVHVIDSKKLTDTPFENQSDKVLDFYKDRILKANLDSNKVKIIKLEKTKKNENNATELILSEAQLLKIDLLVFGFIGETGLKQRKCIPTSIKNCLFNSDTPILINKKFIPREKKQLKRYNWLVCLNNTNKKSQIIKILDFCCRLINWESDVLIGYHFNSNKCQEMEMENLFLDFCKNKRILKKKFIFELAEDSESSNFSNNYFNKKVSNTGRMIANTVNFGHEDIDYLLMNHNITKYPEFDSCPTVQIIKFANCNIICAKDFH